MSIRRVAERLARIERKNPKKQRALLEGFWKYQMRHQYVPTEEQAKKILSVLKEHVGSVERAVFLGPFTGEWYELVKPLAKKWTLLDVAKRFLRDPWNPYRGRMLMRGKDFYDEFIQGVWDVHVQESPMFFTFELSPLFGELPHALAKILAVGRGLVYIGRYRNKMIARIAEQLNINHTHKKIRGTENIHVHILKDIPEPVRDAARFITTFLKSTPLKGQGNEARRIESILRNFLKDKPKEYRELFLQALDALVG